MLTQSQAHNALMREVVRSAAYTTGGHRAWLRAVAGNLPPRGVQKHLEVVAEMQPLKYRKHLLRQIIGELK